MRLVLFAVALSACMSTAEPATDAPTLGAEGDIPTCNANDLTKALYVLSHAPPDIKQALAIAAIGDACDPAIAAFRKPDQGATAVADYVANHQAVWKRGCTRGMNAFGGLVTKPATERVPHLHAACELERYGWSLDDARGLHDNLLPAIIAAGLIHDRPQAERERWYAMMVGR